MSFPARNPRSGIDGKAMASGRRQAGLTALDEMAEAT